MKKFLARHADHILGVLSGFDRVRFRGTFRQLAHVSGMMSIMSYLSVLLKDFRGFTEKTTARFREGVKSMAEEAGRPVQYLASPQINKEELVQHILRKEGVGPKGLIAAFSTLEICRSYEIRRDQDQQLLVLQSALRKCLHYYVYLMDPMFGLVHVRMQSWFPFNVHIVINGREWLARQMDAAGLAYQRADNCFQWIEDFQQAQELADQQRKTDWPKHLGRLLDQANPIFHPSHPGMKPLLFSERCPERCVRLEPYWSAEQSEWATDVAFTSGQYLTERHLQWTQHAIRCFQSLDIMRFLGSRSFLKEKIHPAFKKEVVSDVAARPEGVRIKHRLGGNSIKMYDKQGSVLRVETTINDAHDLKVFRSKEGDPQGKLAYRRMRKGVADLERRTQLCQSANHRYLDSLAAVDSTTPLRVFTDILTRPVQNEGVRARALNPLGADAALLAAVSRGEYLVKGFRNADIRLALYGNDPEDAVERRRRSARVGRLIRHLRAHGLVKKIPRSQRYLPTSFGQHCLPAILAAREASVEKLTTAC